VALEQAGGTPGRAARGAAQLRAEPLAEALARFDRPATVISESPDAASTQAIKAILERNARP